MPNLEITFNGKQADVLLRADDAGRSDLARLAARFGIMGVNSTSVVVPLDDFLNGLDELVEWPDPDGVSWDPELNRLAASAYDDAAVADQRLGESGVSDEVDPDGVESLLGAAWKADLTSFQKRNIARLLSLQHGADFSVPGAGKTREALAVFSALRARKEISRLLVVCPKSAYDAWLYEAAHAFSEPVRVQVLEGFRPSPAIDVALINYERIGRSLAHLSEWLRSAPSMLVLDEAHRMKLGGAGVYGAACMALGPLAVRRLILTGTPAPNSADDLKNLFAFVWPGRGRRVVSEAIADGNLAHASRVLKPLYVRTKKSELGLPLLDVRLHRVGLPDLHREIYDALVGHYSARAEAVRGSFDSLGRATLRLIMAATSPALLVEGSSRYEPLDYQVPPLEVSSDDSLAELLKALPRYEMSPKFEAARSIAASNAEHGRKTLIWSTFIRSLTTLKSLLSGLNPALIYGGAEDRESEIHRFRNDPSCYVLLANPATLGEGISLHGECHDAVYIDRDFQAGRFLQSLDRIHRLGLAPDVVTNVTVLAAERTVDDVVTLRLDKKIDFLGRVLDDPDVQMLADLENGSGAVAGVDAADAVALLGHLRIPAGGGTGPRR